MDNYVYFIKTTLLITCIIIITISTYANDFYEKDFTNNIIQGSYERDRLRFKDSKINNVLFSKIISDS